jgi:hypothetical protein
MTQTRYAHVNKLKKEKENREQEGKMGPMWTVGATGREVDVRKRCRRVNMVEILCTHVYKWKK